MNSGINFALRSSLGIVIALFLFVSTGISIMGIGLNSPQIALAQQPQPPSNLTSVEQQQLMEGISFEIDNVTFSHHMATVNGIQLHYVIGGQGDPVVLIHGWPETWYAWHKVMPALAKNYTVIAPDLRGLGDSSKPPTGYDGKTAAEDIHQLVTQLGFKSIFLTSFRSQAASSNGDPASWFLPSTPGEWRTSTMVDHITSNTGRTRSPCAG
jgi:alpha/beta hydrolase fold